MLLQSWTTDRPLLSRALGDLGTIRRWLAFGLILLVGNVVVLIVGFGILFSWSWQLGLVFLIASLPMWIIGFRFERKYSVVARRAQDQQGDLATAVEESVHGNRVLKAFGRGKHSLERFLQQADELRGTELAKARKVIEVQGNVSALLGELLAPGSATTDPKKRGR